LAGYELNQTYLAIPEAQRPQRDSSIEKAATGVENTETGELSDSNRRINDEKKRLNAINKGLTPGLR